MEQVMEQIKTGGLEKGLNQLFPKLQIPLEECVDKLLGGDVWGAVKLIFSTFSNSVYAELDSFRKLFVWLVVLGVFSGLLSMFSDVFEKLKNSQYCYYIVFLSVITIVLRCYTRMLDTGKTLVENMVLFMRLLFPSYFIMIRAGVGAVSGQMVYQGILLLLYFVERVVLAATFPVVTGYILLVTLNGLWPEEKCRYLIGFLEKLLHMGMKAAIFLVTGVGFLHRLLAPALWRVEKTVIMKSVSMLPGVGNAVEGAAELVLGSAIILKNCVGIIIFLVLTAMCMAPVIRIFLTAFFMKAAASFMGLISEKKLAEIVNGYGEGIFLLLKVVCVALFLFVLALGFICAMGGASY